MLKRIKYYLIAILVIGTIVWTLVFLYNKSKQKPVEYEIITIENRDIYKKTIITGSVIPRKEVLIKPKVSGIISKIYKEPGEYIKKGSIIGIINVIPDVSLLNEAYLRVERAEANLDNVKQEFDRTQKLYEQKLAPQSQFIQSQTNYKNAEFELEAAKNNVKIIKEGAAVNKGVINTQIIATISGTILDIPIKEGDVVIQSNNFNEGTTIASIADMSDLIFEGKVDESEVSKLKANSELEVIIGAIDSKTYDAKLEYIAPKGTDESGTIYFKIKAAMQLKKNESIKVGYSATAEVVLEERLNVPSLPEVAIEYVEDSVFVYLFDSTNSTTPYTKTPIKVGLSDGINIQVIEGINATDRIRGARVVENKE